MTEKLLDAKDVSQAIERLTYEAALGLLATSTIASYRKNGRYYTTAKDVMEFIERNPNVELTEHGLELTGDSNDE